MKQIYRKSTPSAVYERDPKIERNAKPSHVEPHEPCDRPTLVKKVANLVTILRYKDNQQMGT